MRRISKPREMTLILCSLEAFPQRDRILKTSLWENDMFFVVSKERQREQQGDYNIMKAATGLST
jgi:hypothetical protein